MTTTLLENGGREESQQNYPLYAVHAAEVQV